MAKRKTPLETEIDIACENWIAVVKSQDPMEWEAWTRWREEEMGCLIEPENLTVPTRFPPTTMAGVNSYLDVIAKIRHLHGWNSGRGAMPTNPSPWDPKRLQRKVA